MAFDFSTLSVPFRMQPGLQRMQDGQPHVTPLDPGSALYREKYSVHQAGQSRHSLPGFDPGPALRAIGTRGGLPELEFEEDFAVLDTDTGTVPWLCVCIPSHWAPEEKLGLPLAGLHAPVADNEKLLAAFGNLTRLLSGGGHWQRHVWTVTPSEQYDQHPRRHPRTPWPDVRDPADFAARCHLRVEHQTFLPVPGLAQVVFTIRVMLQPLATTVRTPEQALQLREALASMSPAVLDYKQLAAAREPLMAWLSGLC